MPAVLRAHLLNAVPTDNASARRCGCGGSLLLPTFRWSRDKSLSARRAIASGALLTSCCAGFARISISSLWLTTRFTTLTQRASSALIASAGHYHFVDDSRWRRQADAIRRRCPGTMPSCFRQRETHFGANNKSAASAELKTTAKRVAVHRGDNRLIEVKYFG